MPHTWNRLRFARTVLLAAAAGLLLAPVAPAAAKSCCPKDKTAAADNKTTAADSQTTAPKAKDKQTTKPAGTAAGLRVYLDEHGRPTTPPAGKADEAAVPAAFSTSAAGLRQVPGAGPAGGVKVDLEGRFQAATEATTAPDGTIQLNCVTGKE